MKKRIVVTALSVIFLGSLIVGPQQSEAKLLERDSGRLWSEKEKKMIDGISININQKIINEETKQITGYLYGTSLPDLKGLEVIIKLNDSLGTTVGFATTDDSGRFTLNVNYKIQANQYLLFRVSDGYSHTTGTLLRFEVDPNTPGIILSNTEHQINILSRPTTKNPMIGLTVSRELYDPDFSLYINGELVDSTYLLEPMAPYFSGSGINEYYLPGYLRGELNAGRKKKLNVGDVYKVVETAAWGEPMYAVGVVTE